MEDISLKQLLLNLCREFNNRNAKYAIVGGMAVNIYGILRNTIDIDLMITDEEENVKSIKESIISVTGDRTALEINSKDLQGDYPVIRFITGNGNMHIIIDLMSRQGDIITAEEVIKESQIINIEDIPVRVASIETLIKMKENTYRDIDKYDVHSLKIVLETGSKHNNNF